jgi:hypothetical protein
MSGDFTAQQAWVARVLGINFRGVQDAGPTASANEMAATATDKRSADPAEGSVVRLAKGLLLWNATRSHIARQIAELKMSIVTEAQDLDDEDYQEIIGNFGELDEVLDILDDSLSDVLNDMRDATDPTAKNKLSAAARKIIQRYQNFVASSALVSQIDNNGFIPTNIKPRVEQALAAVLGTI